MYTDEDIIENLFDEAQRKDNCQERKKHIGSPLCGCGEVFGAADEANDFCVEDTEICNNNQSDDDDDTHEPSKAFTFLVSVGMRDSVYETIAEC